MKGLPAVILATCLLGSVASAQVTSGGFSHPERDIRGYYLDDAECLDQANAILFGQLEKAESQRTSEDRLPSISGKNSSDRLCTSNKQRDRIHASCMKRKGWLPAN